MPVYLIGDVSVIDPAAYEQYREATTQMILRHQGQYMVRGGEIEVIAGEWRPRRLIVLVFPDKASVRGYLSDPEFARLGELRQRALQSNIVMVDGVEPGSAGS